jgi:hypothetical protein
MDFEVDSQFSRESPTMSRSFFRDGDPAQSTFQHFECVRND